MKRTQQRYHRLREKDARALRRRGWRILRRGRQTLAVPPDYGATDAEVWADLDRVPGGVQRLNPGHWQAYIASVTL